MPGTQRSSIKNYLTIDVEDYFQVAAFEDIISPSAWDSMEQRVERNTSRILDILGRYDIKATFFVVGWTAERFPELVRKIKRLDMTSDATVTSTERYMI